MAGLSHYPKNMHPLQTWSTKFPSPSSSSSSSSSTLSSMKVTKTLIQTLLYTQFFRLLRALTKAKSVLSSFITQTKASKNKWDQRVRFGSFRLHYNWSSSHLTPAAPARSYYDPSRNISTVISEESGELSGYLQWLEDKNEVDGDGYSENYNEETMTEDIDRLAELFIASCHEKFLLEKQESYRRFQEMLARSV